MCGFSTLNSILGGQTLATVSSDNLSWTVGIVIIVIISLLVRVLKPHFLRSIIDSRAIRSHLAGTKCSIGMNASRGFRSSSFSSSHSVWAANISATHHPQHRRLQVPSSASGRLSLVSLSPMRRSVLISRVISYLMYPGPSYIPLAIHLDRFLLITQTKVPKYSCILILDFYYPW